MRRANSSRLGTLSTADHQRRAGEARARGRAQPDRPLREHRDGVAEPDVPALRGRKPRRHDVRAEQDLLVREPVRDLRQVRLSVGTRTYSAWQPSIVLPKRQPPIAS